MSHTYTVHERFRTWQGEGVHMGVAASFIRLYGCDQRCPWCDAAGTWSLTFRPKDLERITAKELADWAKDGPNVVVVTGGEPTLQDLSELTEWLHITGKQAHLETAGHRPITGVWEWIALSPKPNAELPLPQNVRRANEFKVIVSCAKDIDDGLELLKSRSPDAPLWLHPEWSHRDDPQVLDAISEYVVRFGSAHNVRAGWQIHKLYKVDALDSGSRAPVPLGGVIAHGY